LIPQFRDFIKYVWQTLDDTQKTEFLNFLVYLGYRVDASHLTYSVYTEFAAYYLETLVGGNLQIVVDLFANSHNNKFLKIGNFAVLVTDFGALLFDPGTKTMMLELTDENGKPTLTLTLQYDDALHKLASQDLGLTVSRLWVDISLKDALLLLVYDAAGAPRGVFINFSTHAAHELTTTIVDGVTVLIIPPGNTSVLPDGGLGLSSEGWSALVNPNGDFVSLTPPANLNIPGLPPGSTLTSPEFVKNADGSIAYISGTLANGDSIKMYPGATSYTTLSFDARTGRFSIQIGNLLITDNGVVNLADGWGGNNPFDVANGSCSIGPACDYTSSPNAWGFQSGPLQQFQADLQNPWAGLLSW
jgi:hypothetical protein